MNYNMKDRYGNVIEEVSTDRLYRRITLGELREAKRERQTRITRAVRGPPITGVLQRIYDDFAKEERESAEGQVDNGGYLGRILNWCNSFRPN